MEYRWNRITNKILGNSFYSVNTSFRGFPWLKQIKKFSSQRKAWITRKDICKYQSNEWKCQQSSWLQPRHENWHQRKYMKPQNVGYVLTSQDNLDKHKSKIECFKWLWLCSHVHKTRVTNHILDFCECICHLIF